METNVCNKCGKEVSDNKELCHDCQNKKNDKKRKVLGEFLAILVLVGIAATKSFSILSDKSDNDEL